MVHYCIYCGAALPPDAQLCPRCGRLVPEVEAPPAPAAVPAEEAAVGDPLAAQEAAAAPEQAAEPSAGPPEPAVPQPVEDAPLLLPPDPLPAPQEPAGRPVPPRPAPRAAAPKYAPVGMERAAQKYALPQADLLTTGGVLGLVLLGLLPLVGWIVLLVWAFDSASGPNHRALAKGLLLAKVLLLLLCLILAGLLMAFLWMLPPYFWY